MFPKNLGDEGLAKTLISREAVSARNLYKDGFSMTGYARLFFAMNELPSQFFSDAALHKRLAILEFNQQVVPQDKDTDFAEKVITSELPGVLNWIVVGLDRLLSTGRLDPPPCCVEEMERIQKEVDPLAAWLVNQRFDNLFQFKGGLCGARANEWKPLKDRCIIPPMGDVEDADFQNEIVAHVSDLIATIGLSVDAMAICKQAGYSLRAIYGRLRQEAAFAGIELEESVFLGNDPEIAAKVQSTIEAIGKPRVFIDGAIEPGNCPAPVPKKPKKTARQKQFVKNLGDNGVTILDIVAQIIDETGRPMMAIEIARKFEVNYPEMMFVSKNPRCSINANISKDITLNGKDSRFVKVDRKIGLNQ